MPTSCQFEPDAQTPTEAFLFGQANFQDNDGLCHSYFRPADRVQAFRHECRQAAAALGLRLRWDQELLPCGCFKVWIRGEPKAGDGLSSVEFE